MFASARAALSGTGHERHPGSCDRAAIVTFSHDFQTWALAPFTTLTIMGTSAVDGLGYAPQYSFVCCFVTVTLQSLPSPKKALKW